MSTSVEGMDARLWGRTRAGETQGCENGRIGVAALRAEQAECGSVMPAAHPVERSMPTEVKLVRLGENIDALHDQVGERARGQHVDHCLRACAS